MMKTVWKNLTEKYHLLKDHLLRKAVLLTLASVILFTACGAGSRDLETTTPEDAAEQALESARQLDLESFNACTDNYIGTRWDFSIFPVEKEYKVFNELLQPYIKKGKWYKEKYRFAEKAVENLDWKIGEIQEEEDGKRARILLTLENKNISEAMERYVTWITEDTIDGIEDLVCTFSVSGLADMVTGMVNECDDDLIRFIDETEDTWTTDVTVTAYKEDGKWKIHLTDELINALMGNVNSFYVPD